MSTTFLHEEKIIPPDGRQEPPPPICKACGATIWLVRLTENASDAGTKKTGEYECKNCGMETQIIREDHDPTAWA